MRAQEMTVRKVEIQFTELFSHLTFPPPAPERGTHARVDEWTPPAYSTIPSIAMKVGR